MTTAESTFRRRVLAGVAVATVVLLLYLARGALFPFIITGVLAYLLFPAVKALESLMPWRKRWPGTSRIIAVMGIYALALAVLAGALALVIPPAYRESREFIESLPDYYADARRTIEGWNEAYTTRIPEEVRAQIESSLAELGSILVGVASAVLARTISTVSNTLTVVLGLAMVPVLLFYLLKDQELALSTLYSFLPEDARPHARKVVAIVNRVLGAYIRAQLVLMLFVGVLVFVGLWLLGIRFAVLLAVIAGVFELVPVVGPPPGRHTRRSGDSRHVARRDSVGRADLRGRTACRELSACAQDSGRGCEPAPRRHHGDPRGG